MKLIFDGLQFTDCKPLFFTKHCTTDYIAVIMYTKY